MQGTKGAKGEKGDPGTGAGPHDTEDITLTAATYAIDSGQICKDLYIFCGYNGTCDISFPASQDGEWVNLIIYGQTGAAYKFSILSWGTSGSTTAIASTGPAKAYQVMANAMGGWYYLTYNVGAAGTRA
jgi:hypothetical protein